MSLILEALRKLERDRPQEAARTGVVLLAPRPWPEKGEERRRRLWLVAGAAGGALLVLVLAALAAFWWLRPRPIPPAERDAHRQATPSPSAQTAPAAMPPAGIRPAAMPPAAMPPATSASAPEGIAVTTMPRRAPHPPAATRPEPAPTPPLFRLTAIADHDGQPVAVLNDRVLRVGDALEGAHIVSIGDASVELRLADGRVITVGF